MSITQAEIAEGLRTLGLPEGAKVLVHSAMSSFGHVEGGADAVIDALLEVVGEGGTLLAPTLTGDESLSPDNPPIFDPVNSVCWTGRLPETLRHRPDAVRSLHPTHSVAAVGRDADLLTKDHIDSITPCDESSPYYKMTQYSDGYILLIGVNHASNTTFHAVEEWVGVDYHMQPDFVKATLQFQGQTIERHYLLHQYGTPRNFNIMEAVFNERGVQKIGEIGQAIVRLIHAPPMFDYTVRALRVNHRLLCL